MMIERDRQILNEFSYKLRQRFPEAKIWAFGSRARGDAQPDSDLDICVVVEHLEHSIWKAISDIAWEVGFEYETFTEDILSTLREAVVEEQYADLTAGISDLESDLNALKANDINRFQGEITQWIGSEVASRYAYDKGQVIFNLRYDEVSKKALQLLNNSQDYEAILNP
jgi:predicted nucleotidyltransferase